LSLIELDRIEYFISGKEMILTYFKCDVKASLKI